MLSGIAVLQCPPLVVVDAAKSVRQDVGGDLQTTAERVLGRQEVGLVAHVIPAAIDCAREILARMAIDPAYRAAPLASFGRAGDVLDGPLQPPVRGR
jgi:hypothetical protein